MKNYLSHTFWLLLIVVGTLLAMYFLPSLSFHGHTLRKVDILSDLRPSKIATKDFVASDSLLVAPEPVFIDTCKTGLTCIEDYSDSVRTFSMDHFYEALSERNTIPRPVRVAYYGDSFIEADIFTGDLRSMLQDEYGGSGVGYIPITYNMTGFRPTVHQSFGGWESHTKTDPIGFVDKYQDIAGNYFVPTPGAYVLLKGEKHYALHLDTCSTSMIYFRNEGGLKITAAVNGTQQTHFEPTGTGELQAIAIDGRIGQVQWSVDQCASATFYGVTMESHPGVGVDNFSIRGSSGIHLSTIPIETLQAFYRLRPYDLIVLQFGLNVASKRTTDYTVYKESMKKTIDHLKKAFSDISILLVGVGDREYRNEEDGKLYTMPGVKNLIRFQQAIAAENRIAFWNMYEAMGGEGSIVKMAEKKMANLDYTHINFKGGRHLASLLFEALKYGKEQYNKRKVYEKK